MAIDDPGAEFKLVGGNLCLDFINTVSGRVRGQQRGGKDYRDVIERERLVTGSDVVRWGRTSGAIDAATAAALERAMTGGPAQAAKLVVRARALRDAIYRIFKATTEGWQPPAADLDVLNRELAIAREHEQLVFSKGGFGIESAAEPGALDQLLWPVARSAAELLMGDALARVTQCAGEDCGWLFLDTSRNHSRRWCDMADCGNIAKVRRFRRRN